MARQQWQTRTVHHMVPKSRRWDLPLLYANPNNTISIDNCQHIYWHSLWKNLIPTEVVAQVSNLIHRGFIRLDPGLCKADRKLNHLYKRWYRLFGSFYLDTVINRIYLKWMPGVPKQLLPLPKLPLIQHSGYGNLLSHAVS